MTTSLVIGPGSPAAPSAASPAPTAVSGHRPRLRRALALLAVVGVLLSPAALVTRSASADPGKAPEGHGVWALQGARLVVAPGRTIESGTVVIRDGVIVAAGAGVAIPADAWIEDLTGMTLYPGLIDAYAERPWPEQAPATLDGSANDQIHPEREIAPFAYDEGWVEEHRKAGLTIALVAPNQGVMRGWSALLALGDGGAGANLLRPRAAQHVALAEVDGRATYPTSIMGTVALLRQTILDARWYRQARVLWQRRPDQPRVAYDRSLEALAEALDTRAPVFFSTTDPNSAARAAHLARELELPAVLLGNGHEYQQLPELKAAGLPLILPLSFPQPPKVGEEGDAPEIGLAELRHWDQAPANPAETLGAGLQAALTGFGLDAPSDIYPRVARALEQGLTADQALAAFTTTPAALLGIGERAGTLETGKWANLLVVEGELWVEKPALRQVWIDGRRYEIDQDEAKPNAGRGGSGGHGGPPHEEEGR